MGGKGGFASRIHLRTYMNYIYFIQEGKQQSGNVKIGIANNILGRIKTMQTGNSQELRLLFAWPCDSRAKAASMEKQLHHWFKKYRIRGEWFKSDCVGHAKKIVAHLNGESKFLYYRHFAGENDGRTAERNSQGLPEAHWRAGMGTSPKDSAKADRRGELT